MNEQLLSELRVITAEEQAILDGRNTIDRSIYMEGQDNTISGGKLLTEGKLITMRPHTRFIHFPEHTHDYVEVIYMCAGQTTHIVNGNRILLEQGDLLFLSQFATHEVCRAGESDIAVNFIVMPEFFSAPLTMIGEEQTPLRGFLVDCLCGKSSGIGYLHFKVSHMHMVQNLVENLLWCMTEELPNKRKAMQMTMALLFMQLVGHTETLSSYHAESDLILRILRYVEGNYVHGSLAELAESLHYDISWLSREIKRRTGRTFTQIIQEKRLAQAAFLLKNTRINVSEISVTVGYENVSYFHRIFADVYGKSPKHYRDGI